MSHSQGFAMHCSLMHPLLPMAPKGNRIPTPPLTLSKARGISSLALSHDRAICKSLTVKHPTTMLFTGWFRAPNIPVSVSYYICGLQNEAVMDNNFPDQAWTPAEIWWVKIKPIQTNQPTTNQTKPSQCLQIRKLKKNSTAVSSAGTRSVNFVLVNGNYEKMENK